MTIDPCGPGNKPILGPLRTFRSRQQFVRLTVSALLGWMATKSPAPAADESAAARFSDQVRPVLEQYCYGCHGMGSTKGGVSLDKFEGDAAAEIGRAHV